MNYLRTYIIYLLDLVENPLYYTDTKQNKVKNKGGSIHTQNNERII